MSVAQHVPRVEDPLTTHLPNHVRTILAWVVSTAITVVMLLLALSPQTVAQAHEAGSRAKAQHSHAKLKKHHAKHTAGKKVKGRHPKLSASEARTAAICEDGSSPTPAGEGSFSCGDGSQPACENDATPTLSSDNSTLICGVPERKSTAGGADSACEDGSEPVLMGKGSFSCDDGSEPACADGSIPISSGDGATLVCGVNAAGEDEG
jgi:hypothetical protein